MTLRLKSVRSTILSDAGGTIYSRKDAKNGSLQMKLQVLPKANQLC